MIYLVGGVARSGKTILRKMFLQNYKISGVSTDSIRAMLENGLEHTDISYKNKTEENALLMWPYLQAFIENNLKYSDEDYVIEGDVLLPKYLSRYTNEMAVRCCFVGYSEIALKDKLKNIRQFQGNVDWTASLSNQDIEDCVRREKEKSIRYKKECQRLFIEYFDTSTNFITQINNALKYLKPDNTRKKRELRRMKMKT